MYQQVARQIGLSILRSEFKPGVVLWSEPELSSQFNVSRPVLREALKVLVAKGLIESRPKTGTRVRPRSEWYLLDPDVIAWQCEVGADGAFLQSVCEVRMMIEPMAARLATERASDDEVAFIVECYERLQGVVSTIEEYTVADLQFHMAVCMAAHNELLERLVDALIAPLQASRLVTAQVPGANERAMPLHRAVVEAIRRRDAVVAEAAMQRLILLTSDDIRHAFMEEARVFRGEDT